MPTPDRWSPFDRHWAAVLGVPEATLRGAGVTTVPHARLGDWRGVWIWVRHACAVVSVPADWAETVARSLRSATASSVHDPSLPEALFGDDVDTTIGPTFLGAVTAERFVSAPSDSVRPLEPSDGPAIEVFRSAIEAQQWQHGAIDLRPGAARGEIMAAFDDGQILAMAAMREDAPGVCDPGVVTHPQARGRGLGRAVVSAVTERALGRGEVVLYQTLEANLPAVALARRLGYERYARNIAIRLRNPAVA
ncbi:MAG: GNAT family N-acetyltransferase [Deltaproteobacteria bacterium]|nr:GNAT family N-acetyltransferase [Deltaproteobacteria bacterium]